MKSKVKNNVFALSEYIQSMLCAVGKAQRGSDCEDMYFIEKLEKMANRLGYDLVKRKSQCDGCLEKDKGCHHCLDY